MQADTHVHLFSEHLLEKARKEAPFAGGHALTLQESLQEAAVCGAQMLVLRGWPFSDMALCQEQNRLIAAAMRTCPDKVKGFCTVSPALGSEALHEAFRCFEAGFIGLGELDPVRQNFSLQDPHFLRLCSLCEEADKPLNLYTRFPVCEPHGEALSVRALLQFIEEHPALTLLLSHYGAGLPFYALMPEVQKKLQNVWFDTAPDDSPFLENAQAAVADCLGREGLLYGSNLPFFGSTNEACPPLPTQWEKWLCPNSN